MKTKKKLIFILIIFFVGGFSNIFSNHQCENPKDVSKPITADDNTLIYCNFENTLTSFGGESGLTNGDWDYVTSNPVVDSYSVTLAGTSKNHIKWNYGSALSEGTVECFFHILSTDVANGCDYILEGGDYYDASFGVYHLEDGTLRAFIVTPGTVQHTIESDVKIQSNQIYHFALTWGSRGIELWLNGIKVASNEAITEGLVSYARYYGIGNTPMGSNTQCSDGYWDEFQLSNIQRSSFPQNVTDYSPPDLPIDTDDTPTDPGDTPTVPDDTPTTPDNTNNSSNIWIFGGVFLIGVSSILIIKKKKKKPLKDQPQNTKTTVEQKQPTITSVKIYSSKISSSVGSAKNSSIVLLDPISITSKAAVEPILCKYCGSPLEANQIYCEKCGYKKV